MGVYIKGMETPKNCWECHFGHGETGICVVDFKEHGDWNEPHFCPLVPVPPHGRLIDADALEDKCSRQARDEWNKSTGTNWGYAYATFESDIEDAPTIIPAEEGE